MLDDPRDNGHFIYSRFSFLQYVFTGTFIINVVVKYSEVHDSINSVCIDAEFLPSVLNKSQRKTWKKLRTIVCFNRKRKFTKNTPSKTTSPPLAPSLSPFLFQSAEGKSRGSRSLNTAWLAATANVTGLSDWDIYFRNHTDRTCQYYTEGQIQALLVKDNICYSF